MYDPFSPTGQAIRELESQLYRKVERYELDSLRGDVDRLEYSLRESRAEVDGLRAQLSLLEERLAILEAGPQ